MVIKNYSILCLVILLISLNLSIYGQNDSYIASIEKQRAEKDIFMRDSASSPFHFKGEVKFEPLKYFSVDTNFVFKSKLFPFQQQDTVQIYGTKGEGRKVVKYGYVKINIGKKDYKINVYKGKSKQGEEYYSIWFTDKTTGKQSYYVGRYIDFELNSDKDFVYTIDFNLAYNPYCAYSYAYSCAIPPKEEYIPVPIKAGEMIFHNAEAE